VTIVMSWQTAGNSFRGAGFTWQVDNVYVLNGYGF
jgi:hypothetical protein